ncbi:MAG: AAA family ATPase [Clostridiales bacterium]|nr:AAA family ATPase [Clostridiales bacterium]
MKKAENLSDIVNVFSPKPLKAEDNAFYQKTAVVRSGENYECHSSILTKINQSDGNLHLLLIGHGGCGKSTELRMLAGDLKKNGSPTVIIEALDDLSLNDFTYIDIFMLIVKKLIEYADSNKLAVPGKILEAFEAALSTKTIDKYKQRDASVAAKAEANAASSILANVLGLLINITASLKLGSGIKEELRREIKPMMTEITIAVNALINEINNLTNKNGKNGRVVIIIDGLEKCHYETVKKLFVDDVTAIKSIDTHIVISCPIALYRSPDASILLNCFDLPEEMPMIKTHNSDKDITPYTEGISVIKDLILKRADESLFEDDVLEEIIKMGGGNLRDTFLLLTNSAHIARMNEKVKIDKESSERTFKKYAFDLFIRVRADLYAYIKPIYERSHNPVNSPELTQLLYACVVFEYNGERWVDLHPLIRRYIDNNPEVIGCEKPTPL